MIIDTFKQKKVIDYVKNLDTGRVLLIFNHGLGDFMNFLPLFNLLQERYPKIDFKIGYKKGRGFHYINNNAIEDDNISEFDLVFRLKYPEPTGLVRKIGPSKPYLCNKEEIGLSNFIWKPYEIKNIELNNFNSNMVGVHFWGVSNSHIKCPDLSVAEKIWNNLKMLNYQPFEVHFEYHISRPHPKNKATFINSNETIRYMNPSLLLMIDMIRKCKYFIGVDSGPLYLAISILGIDSCIAIQRNMQVSWYLPIPIKLLDISKGYQTNSLSNLIEYRNK